MLEVRLILKRTKIPYIAQLGSMDCGAACLAMLFNYYRCKVDIVDISTCIRIGRDGMSLSMMKETVEKYGFKFFAYQYSYEQKNLDSMLPAILCNDSHYIVVERVRRNGKYTIIDPAQGRSTVDFSEIKNLYRDILVFITPGPNVKKIPRTRSKVEIKIKVPQLLIATVFMLLAQLITLCVPVIVQEVIDGLSRNVELNVCKILLVIFLVTCSFFCLSWLRQAILLHVNMDMFKRMIDNMVHKVFRLDLSFFEWHTAGDIGNRFNNINQLNDIITNGLSNILIQGITSFICLFAMLYISLSLTAFTVLIAVLQVIIMEILNKRNLLKTREYLYTQSTLQGDLVDTLGNIVEIKCMGMDEPVGTNLQDSYAGLITKFNQKTRISNLMSCFTSTVSLVFPLAIYLIGSFGIHDKSMTMGQLIAYVTLVGYFTAPFTTIVMMLPSINSVKEVMLRYKELMNFQESFQDGAVMDGEFVRLKVDSVSYCYSGGQSNALNEVSLDIRRGERVAIVGLSGSGKSTLIKALLGAVEITQGNIYINDYDIKDISREQVYKWFSIVTQNPMCLNASIRKNVDITGSFSDEEIWSALKIAELKDEIQNMPLGLDTIVGEGGQNISGGQRQRLAIARALISKTEVIIFDEATSNLDQITEKKIYNNLRATNKTQIIITHRLASIRSADSIYVLNRGKLIEHGTHEALLKTKGWYYESLQ